MIGYKHKKAGEKTCISTWPRNVEQIETGSICSVLSGRHRLVSLEKVGARQAGVA